MALTAGSVATAADIVALKARVKQEMQRRAYGARPLTGYAAASYDYTTTPVAGGKILSEHGTKIITPLDQITSQGYNAATGQTIKALNVVSSNLSTYEAQSITGSSSCSSNCSGLCVGCSNTCTGSCTGSCTGTCTGSCTSCTGCSGGCTSCSGCSGGCSGCRGCGGCGGCSGSCSGCGSSCQGK